MSGINKATRVNSVDCRTECFSLGHLDIELLEQSMEEPWDLAMLIKKLNGLNWFCEVAEA